MKRNQNLRFKIFDDVIKYWRGVDTPVAETLCLLASRMKTIVEDQGYNFDWDDIEEDVDIEIEGAVD